MATSVNQPNTPDNSNAAKGTAWASKAVPFLKQNKMRILSFVCALIMIVFGMVGSSVAFWAASRLGMITYDTDTPGDNIDYSQITPLPPDLDNGSVTNRNDDPDPIEITGVELRGNTDAVTNIMLIGIDGRYGEEYKARSDTNMILSVNSDIQTIKMASLLRDTWVTIPGLDRDADGEDDIDKLNAAFYYGGFELLSKTIAHNFKLDIDKYIAVDFAAFEKAVDALGGIDIELSKEEAEFIPVYSDNPDRFADNPDLEPLGHEAGVYHLNGQQTLAYCRIRTLYLDSDFSRQSNQRKVIEQLLQKAQRSDFATLTRVIDAVLPYVKTNMTQQELLNYAMDAVNYIGYSINNDYAIPDGFFPDGSGLDFQDMWIGDGLGMWLTDPNKSILLLHQYLYNIPES